MKRLSSFIIPYAIFMVILVILPLVIMAGYAVTDSEGNLTLHYLGQFTDEDVFNTFLYSFGVAMETTLLCILLGYPIAYFLSRKEMGFPSKLIVFFIIPMGVNMLLNTFALVAVLDLLHIPLGETALVIGMVYNFLPFMVQPLYNSLCKLDSGLIDAALDLGASKMTAFFRVVVPVSLPGIISGVMMVFMPTISTFAISELLTMNKIRLFGSVVQGSIGSGMLNFGAALSIIMLLVVIVTQLFVKDR